ncbi:MAG: hypothetical protein ACRDF7_06400 [Candidatus Limnocylindrales bacterium]
MPLPPAPRHHDPRAFLARLRPRTVAAAFVAFGAFFGLAAGNVVGVTAHAPTVAATLAPGDFFGVPGATISHRTAGGAVALPPVPQPRLGAGGGAPMLSSGGS